MVKIGFGASGLVFIAIEWVGTFLHPPETCHPVAYGSPRAPESGCLSSCPRAATAAAATLLPPARWSRAAIGAPAWKSILVDQLIRADSRIGVQILLQKEKYPEKSILIN